MDRPRLLDLFCGVGGCSVGYHRAGFDVTGVDIDPKHRYPFFDVIQGDALAVLSDPDFIAGFDAIHASPPCQAYSIATVGGSRTRDDYPQLIAPVRDLLRQTGLPYVIENVPGAPLVDPVMLCGSEFDLGAFCNDGQWRQLRRHRLFESNLPLTRKGACRHTGQSASVFGHGGGGGVKTRGYWAHGAESARLLGVDWTDHQPSLSQMIPPAYTEWLGRQMITHLWGEND
jgi:DNA (cytosine-5)-methyltransferase 1